MIFAEKPVAALLLNADVVVGDAARQWLSADSDKSRIFTLREKKHKWICSYVRRGENGRLPPLEIWSWNQIFLENLKTAVNFD